MSVRIHIKSAKDMKEFLINNRRTFTVERTSTGFPTLFYNNIQYYVRDKAMQRSFLNKILCFQNDVVVSQLYKFINKRSEEDIMEESKALEKSLMYKGFTFNPTKQNTIKGVIKIDLNTAYWQTCRIARCVKTSTYNDIVENCLKESRLKLTGSLGKKVLVTQYVEGVKTDFFIKKLPKKRIVFQNVYNRLRKYVDELMVQCWVSNPDNFIGFYTDCFWIKEYDSDLLDAITRLYDVKMEIVDLYFGGNSHNRLVVKEVGEKEDKVYDGQYKPHEFAMYKNFYNFTSCLRGTKTKIIW
jgi:hypothetical protein